jgi:hypothetical protein
MHRVRQHGVLVQFLQRDLWVVVIHA